MNFKDLKISTKLYLGSGVVVSLIFLIWVFVFFGLRSIDKDASILENNSEITQFLLGIQRDHYGWEKGLLETFVHDDIEHVQVQMDHTKCKLGKFLFGPEGEKFLKDYPQYKEKIDELIIVHEKVHDSAKKINKNYLAYDTKTVDFLNSMLLAHTKWKLSLSQSILNKKVFKGKLDYKTCTYGKWYYKDGYKISNPELNDLLKKIEPLHHNFHSIGKKIVAAQKSGQYSKALSIYNKELTPLEKELGKAFENINTWYKHRIDQVKLAGKILDEETNPNLKATQILLADLLKEFNEQTKMSNENLHKTIPKQKTFLSALGLIGIIIGLLISLIITKMIVVPINGMSNMLEDIANGDADLSKRLKLDRKDEIGVLGKWFDGIMGNIQSNSDRNKDVQTGVQSGTHELNIQSEKIGSASKLLNEKASSVSQQADSVAGATQEMSANLSTISSAAEESQSNLNTVASATEEMTATIMEIAENSERARTITNEAMINVNSASQRVDELDIAAKDISKVTQSIMDITDQTKLLALNATIEAARAGEAGKGFAVVANEVKELAKQSNEATEDISVKVEAIQNSTNVTVKEIRKISKVMGDVTELITSIATAVEEQNVTTREIAQNISQAGSGVSDVVKNVVQVTDVSRVVADHIKEVNASMTEIQKIAGTLDENVASLDKSSTMLGDLADKFN